MIIAHIVHGVRKPKFDHIQPLLEQQLRDGHTVIVFGPRTELVTLKGAERVLQRRNTPPWQKKGAKKRGETAAILAAKVLEQILERRPDVIHDHTGLTSFFSDTAWDTLPPCVVTLTSIEQAEFFQNWRHVHPVANCETLQGRLASVADFIYYPVNGISTLKRQSRRQHRLVWLGEMSPEFGSDLAIKVAREGGFDLLLAGNPAVPPKRELWARGMVEEAAQEAGFLHLGEYAKPLLGAAGLILPYRSYSNVYGQAWQPPFENPFVVRALGAGIPVLGTECDSLSEIVGTEGRRGRLCNPANLSDAKLVSWMVEQLGDLGDIPGDTSRANEFLPSVAARKYEDIYRALNA
jgi:glycosyltransferase involved in cell wall biosynthesis